MSTRKKAQTNGASTNAGSNGNGNGHAPLTKAEALALATRTTSFSVPEWRRSILLRPLTPAWAIKVEREKSEGMTATLEMVRQAWVDERGLPMFDDIAPLEGMDIRAIGRIAKHLMHSASAIADEGAEKK